MDNCYSNRGKSKRKRVGPIRSSLRSGKPACPLPPAWCTQPFLAFSPSHFLLKAPVTPAGPVSTLFFLHHGELIVTPGTQTLGPLWHHNGGILPGMIHQFKEYRIPFEEDTFVIFPWSLIHRGVEYLEIPGREGLCNWRKFTASNSNICKERYPKNGTYTSKKVTDGSEPDKTGKPARDFFSQVTPHITRDLPLPFWKFV